MDQQPCYYATFRVNFILKDSTKDSPIAVQTMSEKLIITLNTLNNPSLSSVAVNDIQS